MKKSLISIIILFIASLAIVLLKFAHFIPGLNAFMINRSIDSFKSYFNFAWCLKYAEGIKHHGINYPYGDHLHYINSHPIYLYFLRMIDGFLPVSDYGVGIINGGMVFSMVLAIPLLFMLLRKFGMPHWYAIICALIIQFLFPQMARIHGHFEMVVAFVIPLYWLLLIKYNEGKRTLLWGALMILCGILTGLLSAYFVAFCSIFTLAFLLVEAIQQRNKLGDYWKKAVSLLVIAAIPLIFIKGFVDLSDWYTDRPQTPWGFYRFVANFASVFTPERGIVGDILPGSWLKYDLEGRAYVGFPATIAMIALIIFTLKQLITKKRLIPSVFIQDKMLMTYLLSATIVLLYSMTLPFKWGLQFIPDQFPILKQFRAMGRFSWVFYYVCTVYSASLFYILFKHFWSEGKRVLAYAVFVPALLIWGYEAGYNLDRVRIHKIQDNKLQTSYQEEYRGHIEKSGYEIEDFQAILCIPFASTNGDKMLFNKGEEAFKQAMIYSFHTGLPLIQSFSPRLSMSTALSSIQLLSDACIEKSRLKDMTDKPILVVSTHETKRDPERKFIRSIEEIYSSEDVSLYILPVEKLKADYQACAQDYQLVKREVSAEEEIFVKGENQSVFYMDFEQENVNEAPASFSGNKAFYLAEGKANVMNEILSNHGLSGPSVFSFWLYFDVRATGVPDAHLDILNEKNEVIKSKYLFLREQHNVHNYWIRGSTVEDVKKGFSYQLRVAGKYISLDDLLVKPLSSEVLIQKKGIDLYNNYPFYLNQ
jgi:hypothetical protein